MKGRNYLKVLGLAVVLVSVAVVSFGEEGEPGTLKVSMSSPGFSPSMSYQNFGNGEYVNTASGGLTVVHNSSISLPQNMGASLNFKRVYNSKDASEPYKEAYSLAAKDNYPCWGFLGPGWRLSFGRVFMRSIKITDNSQGGTNPNLCVYFYEDEMGTQYRLYPVNSTNKYLLNNWEYVEEKYPYENKWYKTEDGSFLIAKFDLPENGDITQSHWILYFPDGSKKIFGGTNAFILPAQDPADNFAYCTNEKTNGWYCTAITDKANNNPIQIEYWGYDAQARPYAGSIKKVTDQFGRETNFYLNENGPQRSGQSFGTVGLLSQITYPDGSTDDFTYTPDPVPCNYDVSSVMLWKVKDPENLETVYEYKPYGEDPRLEGVYLKRIYYPTGAVSEYSYQNLTIVSPTNSTSVLGDVIDQKDLYIDGNRLNWKWDRSYSTGPPLPFSQTQSLTGGFPVLVGDPYGVWEAHCFMGYDMNNFGQEYGVIRFNPAVSISDISDEHLMHPLSHLSDISYTAEKYSLVWDQGFKGVFPRRITEKEYEGGALKWVKTERRSKYDGRGHFRLIQAYPDDRDSLPSSPTYSYKETALSYDIRKPDLNSNPQNTDPYYDLSLLATSYTGGVEIQNGPAFKASTRIYDLTSGLLSEVREYDVIQSGYTTGNDPDDGTETPSDQLSPPNCAYRKTTINSYLGGNPTSITYSNAGTALPSNTYSQNLTWYRGVVESLKWDNFSYYEFQRKDHIEASTSRILEEEDANGFTTTFEYDSLGRIIKIQPDSGEVPTLIEYPLDDSGAWQTGHIIRFYRGNKDSMPQLEPGDAISSTNLNPKDTFVYYEFDDLGRLIKTSNVMPDNTWSSTEKFYDPVGNVVFESFPYQGCGKVGWGGRIG